MFFIPTDNAQAQSGKLTNNFDKDKVQKELDLQREVTESFGQTVTQTSAMIADKLSEESRKKKYEAAVELENAKNALKENDSEINRAWEKQAQANFDTANREAKEWETGGSQRRIIDSALNVVSTFLAGRPATEVVASGLSPTINHQIKEMTTDKDGNVNTPVNLMAHAIWGGIEAYAGNRNVAAGATGAVAGEAAASAISHLLYEKSPDKLTQEEKLTVSTLSQAAASIAGGTLANNADGAIIAAKTAKDAVENNAFTPETLWDAGNVVIGSASFVYNIQEGNYGLAALDGVGVAYDVVATVVPFLPAGASAGIKAYRAGNSVKQSVAIAGDVTKTAKAAHQAAKDAQNLVGSARAVGSKIHRDTGRRIGEASGKASKLSDNSSSYFISANKATGKQPDLSWKNTNTWGDLTTSGQWNAHVKKYESSFGSTAIPIIYERGKGVTNYRPMRSFFGSAVSLPSTIIDQSMEDK